MYCKTCSKMTTCNSCERNEKLREERMTQIKIRQKAYGLICDAEKQLKAASLMYAQLRNLFNSQINPDEVDYNFHDVIGRINDTLIIQEKFAFDLRDQGDSELDY